MCEEQNLLIEKKKPRSERARGSAWSENEGRRLNNMDSFNEELSEYDMVNHIQDVILPMLERSLYQAGTV